MRSHLTCGYGVCPLFWLLGLWWGMSVGIGKGVELRTLSDAISFETNEIFTPVVSVVYD